MQIEQDGKKDHQIKHRSWYRDLYADKSLSLRDIHSNQAAASVAVAPNNFLLHSPQTASKPLTTSPQTRPASRSLSFRSHCPLSIQRCPSSRSSSSRLISATSSRADRRRRDAVDVSWRDSWSVSLSVRRVRVRSDV